MIYTNNQEADRAWGEHTPKRFEYHCAGFKNRTHILATEGGSDLQLDTNWDERYTKSGRIAKKKPLKTLKQQKIYHANTNPCKAVVGVLTSDKVDFRRRTFISGNKGH